MGKPMKPSNSGGKAREKAPEGRHNFRLLHIVQLGTVRDKTFKYDKGPQKGQFVKKNEVKLYFELVDTAHVFDEAKGPQPFMLNKTFTFSLGEKANMRKFFEQWRGKKYTDEEINEKFDLTAYWKFPGELQVAHETAKDGKVYANISVVMPISPGTKEARAKVKKLQNTPILFRLDDEETYPEFANLYKWDQERIKESEEWKEVGKKILAVCPEEEEGSDESESEAADEGEDAPY